MRIKKNIKVLLIYGNHSADYWPDLEKPFYKEIYSKILPKMGCKVNLITGSKIQRGNHKWNGAYAHIYKRINFSNIYISKLYKVLFPNIKMIIGLIKILKINKYNIVDVTSWYWAFWCLITRIYYSLNITIVLRDSFPTKDALIYNARFNNLRFGKIRLPINIITKKIEYYIFKKIDFIFTITDLHRYNLKKEGIPYYKMATLKNGVNCNEFTINRNIPNNIKKIYNIDMSDRVLIYIGTLSKSRNIDFILNMFYIVNKKIGNVKLLIIGGGKQEIDDLRKISKFLKISSKIIFTGRIVHSEIPKYLSIADVGVSPIPPTPIFKVSSPTKVLEIMAMGIPIVVNEEIPEQKKVVSNSKAGICTKYDKVKFAEKIIYILKNKDIATKMGQMGIKYIKQYRDYHIIARKLINHYQMLLND